MGQLFSRAFKRLTQCTSNQSSRNQAQQSEADSRQEEPVAAPTVSAQQQDNSNDATDTELIPVGKSIDDAASDYVAAENGQDEQRQEPAEEPMSTRNNNNTTSEAPKQDVEGAVIKIQALVRGHLTRKALKDAHQQHSLPAPNALGQSQFDEESLTSGPPSAIFSTASPLAMGAGFQAQAQLRAANGGANNNGNKTPLESIAEAMETSMTGGNTMVGPQLVEASAKTNDDRRRLMKLCTRSATSPAAERLETPPASSGAGAASPVPSEANASIDLGRAQSCDTPASCSIDILDHNIKPTDKLASVLHHQHHQQHQHSQDQNQQPNSLGEAPELSKGPNCQSSGSLEIGERTREWVEKAADVVGEPSVGEVSTSADLEEEEAAAIRIQSAFRGYRTRKNSPYRTRSPTLASATSSTADQGASHLDPLSGQQDELEMQAGIGEQGKGEGEGEGEGEKEDEAEWRVPNPERRASRPRQRDLVGNHDDDMPAQQLVSLSTTTMSTSAIDCGDEDSTEAPTVLETTTPALASATESAPGRQLMTTSSQLGGREVSLDSTEANVSELDSSQAISGLDTSASMPLPLDNGGANSTVAHHRQQPKSEASTELDTTDSSILGGPALSLDMVEAPAAAASAAPTDLSTTRIGTTADESARPVGDEDKSLGATGGSTGMMPGEEEDEEEDGRRLVEDTDQGCALVEEAATGSAEGADEGRGDTEVEDEDERELDQLLRAAAEEVGALNEEEQRAIELESDDIERRDPRGQASEERAKSPQIRTEPPQFAAASEPSNGSSDNNNNNNTLTVEDGLGASTSGRSSPVQNSSNGNSSEEYDDNDSDGGTKSPTQEQQQQQQPGGKRTTSKNKKRNNRNKRKGKK